jgi:hypothetical protein
VNARNSLPAPSWASPNLLLVGMDMGIPFLV